MTLQGPAAGGVAEVGVDGSQQGREAALTLAISSSETRRTIRRLHLSERSRQIRPDTAPVHRSSRR